jgi:hypothetical protein
MKKTLILTIMILVITAVIANAGVQRIEISPSLLMNLADGHSGSLMGGALTADVFFNRSFALRTTVGLTKDRYFPADRDFSESDHSFWLSLAPYGELHVGSTLKPYIAVLGTFTTGSSYSYRASPVGFDNAPVERIRNDRGSSLSSYSFGLSVGSKVRLTGSTHLFAEVSHYFYTSITDPDRDVYFGVNGTPFARSFDFERNPTYISAGLTYGFDLKK